MNLFLMIVLDDFHFSYNTSSPIFSGVSASFQLGKSYLLLGKNGIGKTTLLKILSGDLISARPNTYFIDGKDTSRQRLYTFRHTFYVSGHSQSFPFTIRAFGKLYAPLYPKFDAELYKRTVKDLGLALDDRIDQLTLGQKKLALTSFAIATNPSFLLLDDPTDQLDSNSREALKKVLHKTHAPSRGVIVASQSPSLLEGFYTDVAAIASPDTIIQSSMQVLNQKLDTLVADSIPESLSEIIIHEKKLPNGNCRSLVENHSGGTGDVDLDLLLDALPKQLSHIQSLLLSPLANE